MIFQIVEHLAHSPVWLGMCGFGVIVIPALGIQYIYRKEQEKGG